MILDYSLKFDEYVVNYDENLKQPIVEKNGELREGPSTLENRQYISGEAVENYGGYNWHVIGDDGENVTLLMDQGQNGNYNLPEDSNGHLDASTGMMSHCTDGETSNCTWNGTYYVYSWDKSLIQEYLNNTFYDYLKEKIGNDIMPSSVCNDKTIGHSLTLYSYGGFLESEITAINEQGGSAECNSGYSDYNVRLISSTEYYNVAPQYGITSLYEGQTGWSGNTGYIPNIESITVAESKSWLCANQQSGNWWSMSAFSNKNTILSGVQLARFIMCSSNTIYSTEGASSLYVRPVITVKK